MITNTDDNLIKIIISNNCFKKIILLFEENCERKNLVFSSILDLFDTINKLTMKKLILHLVILCKIKNFSLKITEIL